jgi:hypothetical protein
MFSVTMLTAVQYSLCIRIEIRQIEMRQLFIEIEILARKLGLQINQEKTKHMIVGRKNTLTRKTGHLKLKDYKFERVESFKYLGAGPYLRTGQRGPGPGRHIKKIEIEVWYVGGKRLSTREKFKGDL